MHWVVPSLWAVAGVLAGMVLGVVATKHLRASKRLRTGAAFAAALLSSFVWYDTRDRAAIEETENETKRKKDDQSGDPPEV